MNWNYVATFTGTGPMAHLPTGAVDESGTLWVMWGDAEPSHTLTYFSHPLPQNSASLSVKTTRLPQGTVGSPCLMCVDGHFVTLWVDASTGSSGDHVSAWGMLDPEARRLDRKGAFFQFEHDGALAAFFPRPDPSHLFVAYRGWDASGPYSNNPHLYYNNVSGLDTLKPHEDGNKPFGSDLPTSPYQSYYSPAVAAMPDGEIAALFKGPGSPGAADSDDKLYFTSAPNPSKPVFSPPASLRYPGPGGVPAMATSMNRPSLALHGTGGAATLVAVYSGTDNGKLSYLVGTLNGGVTWAAPPQNGTSDGTVPLDDLLANAGADGGPVKLTNPVGVWVTAPGSSNTLYLLVGDQVDGVNITGPLYLVRYGGASH